MFDHILNQQLMQQRTEVTEIVADLHSLTQKLGNKELAQTVSELRNRINEPFMFVVVGEVKAGKSSFINALLETEKEIAKVAPQPMTDTVQQIVYGETETNVPINQYIRRITQPIEILKEIAIVDTPGTNSIESHHQEITEKFIPAADLIVFVFESKNPYTQSAWNFFDFIHADWRKKIIFVLQQKDLMPLHDLMVNEDGVRQQARKKGIDNPIVFSVSAKQEQEGNKLESGFFAVRQYIKENITGGKAPILKLQNNIDISMNINGRIAQALVIRKDQFVSDTAFRNDIQDTLTRQELKSNNQVDILVENLLATYDRVTQKIEGELSNGLSFPTMLVRSFKSIFSKTASSKDWLNDLARELELNLNAELKSKLNEGVLDIADSIQQMAKMIDLKIQNNKTIMNNTVDIFSDIADRRALIIKELQDSFSRFMNRSENFTGEDLFSGKQTISPSIATGSGIAIVGVILAAVTKGMVFDVTGGVLTTIGLLFAGATATIKRKQIMDGYRKEIERGRTQIATEVNNKLKTYVQHIKEKIDANFTNFDAMMQNEQHQINDLSQTYQNIEKRIMKLNLDKVSVPIIS